jgi:hypothetical protein
MSDAKIIIRPVESGDKDLIFSTWLRGQYYGSDYFTGMNQDEYFKRYGKYITSLICAPGTHIDCAVLEDAPTVVLGYIAYNDQKLYWSYVKRDYRKQGILNLLLKNMDFTEYSGHTKVGKSIATRKKLNFNPLE